MYLIHDANSLGKLAILSYLSFNKTSYLYIKKKFDAKWGFATFKCVRKHLTHVE
jgi:hypothetical protein